MSMNNALFVFLIAAVLYLIYQYLTKEEFINEPGAEVTFLNAQQTASFLLEDKDMYFANLSPTDLYARQAKTNEDYKKRAAEAAGDLTSAQKTRYAEAARKGDEFFRTLNMPGIDTAKLVNVPWVIAYTKGTAYEEGLPHTRANIIFVSSDMDETPEDLLRVLVHEKVHVYTRMYPKEAAYFLESNGFTRWKRRQGVPRIRANPDLDEWIYIDPTTEKPMVTYYSSDHPENINDTAQTNAAFEHPYELIAYRIAAKVKK